LENLTPFYDSTTGTGFFNLKQQETPFSGPFSDKELRSLLEIFSSCLDLQQLVQTYFSELRARVPVNHFSIDTPVGNFRAGKDQSSEQEKTMLLEFDDDPAVKMRHFYCNTLSIRAKQIIREFNKLIRIPVRNAIEFTRLRQVAMKDTLTCLGNRSMYNETLERLCHQAHRKGEKLTLLVLDLDNFKPVNDYYGHAEGDKVLIAFADILTNTLRGCDYAFRFGGDEFCCLIQNGGQDASMSITHRLVSAMRSNMLLKKYKVTCSIGSATLATEDSPESLFQRADEALYEAKNNGRDCVVNA